MYFLRFLRKNISFCATLMYNSGTKGSGRVTNFERLEQMLKTHNGILQTSQVIAAGISKPTFYDFIKEKKLEQAAHGVYVSADAWLDAMHLIHLRCSQAVFSHETALFFYDLTDREPSPYTVTVKRGYSPSRLKADGIAVYTIRQELHEIGIVNLQTPFGHIVPVYNMERTICDLIRCRSKIEIQTFKGALKQYAFRKDKNLHVLMRYAGLFHVEKILRQYLEVLL